VVRRYGCKQRSPTREIVCYPLGVMLERLFIFTAEEPENAEKLFNQD